MTETYHPDPLAVLIDEFERSGVGELRLSGPEFDLHLRARRPTKLSEKIPSDPGGKAA